MIALDTNVLVYSHRLESPFHEAAKELVESFRSNPSPWAIPWPCVHEFLSIVTHPKVYKTPATLAEAFASVDAWLAGGNLQLLGESDGYFEKLRAIAKAAQLKGPAHPRRPRRRTVPSSRRARTLDGRPGFFHFSPTQDTKSLCENLIVCAAECTSPVSFYEAQVNTFQIFRLGEGGGMVCGVTGRLQGHEPPAAFPRCIQRQIEKLRRRNVRRTRRRATRIPSSIQTRQDARDKFGVSADGVCAF